LPDVVFAQRIGRVGRWRGGLGTAYLLPALSIAGASIALPCSVSTLPLIKPDVRFSRIRLSDKDSCVRPRDVAIAQAELGKSQLVMQVFVGEACVTPTPQLVFPSQPLTDPLPGMVIDPSIGFIDWALAKVVRPSHHHAVETTDLLLRVQPTPIRAGQLADPATDRHDLLLRRALANEAKTRLRRVAATEGVTQKIKRFIWKPTNVRLLFVDRQLQPMHDAPHGLHRRSGVSATADHKVVGVIHDLSLKTLFVPQYLPRQDKSPHVEVAQQR